jgi:hypothetical protein
VIVCEYSPEFQRPDPDDPTYAFGEVDVFAQNPEARRAGKNGAYRLSVRRNLVMRRWELYRSYRDGTTPKKIDAMGTLAEVLDAANRAWVDAWGWLMNRSEKASPDVACDHTDRSPGRSYRCAATDPARADSRGRDGLGRFA